MTVAPPCHRAAQRSSNCPDFDMITVCAAGRVLDLDGVAEIKDPALLIEQHLDILCAQTQKQPAEAGIVERLVLLAHHEQHGGVDLALPKQRDPVAVFDRKGRRNALHPRHFGLHIGKGNETRLIGIFALCDELDRLRLVPVELLRS